MEPGSRFHQAPLTQSMGLVITPESPGSILELNAYVLRDKFKKHAALIFRGFNVSEAEFHEFTSRFLSPIQLHDSGNGAANRVTTVYKGDHSIPYHAELSATPVRPDIIWFHCITPPERGGETTVCDGVEVFQRLRPGTQELFAEKLLRFAGPLTPDMAQIILRVVSSPSLSSELAERKSKYQYHVDDNGNMMGEYITPAVQNIPQLGLLAFANAILPFSRFNGVTFDDGAPIPWEVLREVELVCEDCTILIPWKTGEVAMMDNWRCMHGRRAFEGPRVIRSVFGRSAS
jgi:alpha-ketoglutarate-dependent taurine dioxygenase